MISYHTLLYYLFISLFWLLTIRVVYKTNLVLILFRTWQSFADGFHLYQLYKVPQFNDQFQENQLYRQISTYLNSLPSFEDSDLTNLLSGPNSNDIFFSLDPAQSVNDTFLGARLNWTNRTIAEPDGSAPTSFFVLRIKRSDKRRIFRQYFQHILTVADEIDQRKKEIKLHYVNSASASGDGRRWRSVNFTHPASFDTVVVDGDLKSKVKSDLELFLKSKQYYHRLGRVWKRSYLLYGSSGTGKTSFAAAMARFLNYDVYDVDVGRVSAEHVDLKALLLQTTPRSVIVVEDLDRLFVAGDSKASAAGVLSFMDGIISCCGEERVLVFTMNGEDKERIGPAVLRPGRIDVHVHFPLCDNFSAFKSLASSYLGVKEHKLFPQVEEIFQSTGSGFLSPAEIGEIMLSNRTSPSRAIKTVISALQNGGSGSGKGPQRLSTSGSGRTGEDSGEPGSNRESLHSLKELRKLYGLLKMGSRRKEESAEDLDSNDKEKSRHS